MVFPFFVVVTGESVVVTAGVSLVLGLSVLPSVVLTIALSVVLTDVTGVLSGVSAHDTNVKRHKNSAIHIKISDFFFIISVSFRLSGVFNSSECIEQKNIVSPFD